MIQEILGIRRNAYIQVQDGRQAVSYTHLDVYKRQDQELLGRFCRESDYYENKS